MQANEFVGKWNQLDNKVKTGLAAGTIIIAIMSGWLIFWSMTDDYQVLFSDLQPKDASSIVGELTKMKLPYRLAENGNIIKVRSREVHETRLKLMGKGVNLTGVVGFEIFDKSDFGMTEYAQKVNFQRALQGELARTVGSIREVKHARIHLVLPETSIFKQEKAAPKASVSLVLREGTQLNDQQIAGVQRLISASVPGLDAEQVTVVDQRGVSLAHNEGGEGALSMSGRHLDTKREVEAYLTKKIVAMLDRAYGSGQAIVTVDATINYDRVKTTAENIVPVTSGTDGAVGAVMRRRSTVQQSSSLTMAAAGDQKYSYSGGASPNSSTSEVEYAVGRRVEQVVAATGGVRRLSVAVLVPNHLDTVHTARIRSIIESAAGIDATRGDTVAVHAVSDFVPANAISQITPPVASTNIASNTTEGEQTVLRVWQNRINSYVSPYLVEVLAVMLALLFLATAATIYALRRRGHAHNDNLSTEEREALLRRVGQWIGLDSSTIKSRSEHE